MAALRCKNRYDIRNINTLKNRFMPKDTQNSETQRSAADDDSQFKEHIIRQQRMP
jgi:hypothetical protein